MRIRLLKRNKEDGIREDIYSDVISFNLDIIGKKINIKQFQLNNFESRYLDLDDFVELKVD